MCSSSASVLAELAELGFEVSSESGGSVRVSEPSPGRLVASGAVSRRLRDLPGLTSDAAASRLATGATEALEKA